MNNNLDQFRGEGNNTGAPGRRPGGLSSWPQKTFASFKIPVYRLYYLSMVGHWSSMNMQMLARNLLVYRITGSGAILGILALANAVPMILVTLPGGVLADRLQKKTVIQFGQLASAIVSLGTTLALVFGYLSPERPDSWWVLAVSAILQGAVMGIIMPSRSAIISEIVGPDHLMNAISLNNLGMNVFRILSPALAGFLIDVIDFWAVFAIMTAMIIMSMVCIMLVPPTRVKTVEGGSSLTDILEGWRYLRSQKTILLVLIFTVSATILGAPYAQLLPMFTEDILKVSATDMGVLIMVSGIGAMIGSLILASLSNRKRGLIMLFAGLIMSIALVGFAFSQWWYLSLLLIVFIGLGSSGQMALGNSLVQYYSDASYRGRVMSFFMLGFGFSSLGAFFAGIISEVDWIGVQWSVGSMAILLIIITVLTLAMVPRIRKLN